MRKICSIGFFPRVFSRKSAKYRRVKKVLALVMAFAMAFTMMATAGAAYTDQADIEATEAVEMLNALGVMTGDPDGSFRPNDTITRAEAARMIYTIRTNSDNADAYKDMQTTFKDVSADSWYAGYVKHCQAAGIVSGTSATTFEPSRDVTTVELALMCLRVMGYDPAKADIGGSTWSTKTISLATEAGILSDVNTSTTAACPRQWAAQLMYNMVEAPTVEWSTDSNTYSKYFEDGSERDSVGKEYLKLWINVGTLESISDDNLTISMSKSDAEDSDSAQENFTKVGQDYSSLLGQKVKVMFRDGKANSVIGVYPLEDNTSYTVNMKDIEKDGEKVKFDGKSYGFDDKKLQVEILDVDGKVSTEEVTSAYFDVDANKGANATKLETVTFVDNDGDGKLNIAFITQYAAPEVSYVGSDRITAEKTYKMEDHNIADDLEKDDYAMISWNRFDDCKDIVKAEVVADTFGSSKNKGEYQQYKVGDTWYNIDASKDATSGWDDVSVGDTVKAYIVAGVIVDIDTDDGTGAIPTNIAVVVGLGDNALNGDQAKLRFFDGTLKTVTLDKVVKADGTKTTAQKGYAYKVSGSDSNTRLEQLKDQKYNGYEYAKALEDYDKTVPVGVSGDKLNTIDSKVVDDNAVIILWNEGTTSGDSKKITGKQFKAIASDNKDLGTLNTAGTAAFTKKVNGAERILLAAVKVKDVDITGTSYDNYGYVTSDGEKVANGDVEFTMWDGSENRTVKVENGSEDDYAKGTLVAYSAIDSENYLQDADHFGTLKELAKDANGTTGKTSQEANLYVDGNRADDAGKVTNKMEHVMNVTSDTHVLVIDSNEENTEDIGKTYSLSDKLKTATKLNAEDYRVNMVYRVEGGANASNDADLDLLVIDSIGAFDFNRPETDDDNQGGTESDAGIKNVNWVLGGRTLTANFEIPAGVEEFSVDYDVKVDGVSVKSGSAEEDTNTAGNVVVGVSGQKVTLTLTLNGDYQKENMTLILSNLTIKGGTDVSAEDINNSLSQGDTTIGGTVSGDIVVPAERKLTLSDDAELKDATLSGTVEFDSNTKITGDVDLSKVTADDDNIGKIAVSEGASLKVDADKVKDAANSNEISVAAGGTLRAETAEQGEKDLIGPADDARIKTEDGTTVEITFGENFATMKINGTATIPEGQTWYNMIGPDASTATRLQTILGTGGKLIVEGTLVLPSVEYGQANNGSKLTVGSGQTLEVAGNIIVKTRAELACTSATVTGKDGATIEATTGGSKITGITGITSEGTGDGNDAGDKWTFGRGAWTAASNS